MSIQIGKNRSFQGKKLWFFGGLLIVSFMGKAVYAADAAKNEGWFVPQAAKPPQAEHREAKPVPVPPPAQMAGDPLPDQPEGPQAPPILPLPPVPTPPAIEKETPPPPAVIGVISVPGVMSLSTAAQEIQQVLGARRDKLARAVQEEERAWRNEQQQLQMQLRNLTTEQIQAREKRLQERRLKDQREFGGKARVIQEAYQVAFHQLERELEQRNGIIGQVAEAHNMNLVFHAEQIVLHMDGQDITEEVATRLNKILPHVYIPAANEDPEVLAKSGAMPTTADEERLMKQASPPEDKSPPSVLRK